MGSSLAGTEAFLGAYYRFDETSGTRVFDVTANHANGTLGGSNPANAPTRVPGIVVSSSTSQALHFDGSSQFVDLGNPTDLNFSGPITLEAWIKPETSSGVQDIVAHGYQLSPSAAEVYLRIANGNYQVGSWNGSDSSASAAMPASDVGQWVHLAGVYDGTHWLLYRNGVLIDSSAATTQGALPVSSTDWAIGARGTGTERFFQGSIDDVRIWNVGRSAAQVQADMGSALAGAPAGLVADYRFDETDGVTAADATANHNTGMLGGSNSNHAPTRVAGVVLGNSTLAFTPAGTGTYTVRLQAIDNDGGSGVTTASVNVYGPPAGVDIHGQPGETVVGQVLPPVTVAVVDADGNTVPDSNAPVTLAIASGPAGAVLGGTTTVNAVNGVATFNDLTVNVPGTYTLMATGGTLAPDTSNPFTAAPAAETAPGVAIRRGKPRRRGRRSLVQAVTLTNTGAGTLTGPLALVLSGLPRHVRVRHAGGRYQGAPYVWVTMPGGALAPGQSVTVRVELVALRSDSGNIARPVYTLAPVMAL
jgi:hypothetical protein